MLALPDGHPALDLVDDPSRSGVRLVTMAMRDGDSDAHVLERQVPQAMLDGDVRIHEPYDRLVCNGVQLASRHSLVSAVLDASYAAAIVDVAHDAEKENERSVRRSSDAGNQCRWVDWVANELRGAVHPPATGGISATSSPD